MTLISAGIAFRVNQLPINKQPMHGVIFEGQALLALWFRLWLNTHKLWVSGKDTVDAGGPRKCLGFTTADERTTFWQQGGIWVILVLHKLQGLKYNWLATCIWAEGVESDDVGISD